MLRPRPSFRRSACSPRGEGVGPDPPRPPSSFRRRACPVLDTGPESRAFTLSDGDSDPPRTAARPDDPHPRIEYGAGSNPRPPGEREPTAPRPSAGARPNDPHPRIEYGAGSRPLPSRERGPASSPQPPPSPGKGPVPSPWKGEGEDGGHDHGGPTARGQPDEGQRVPGPRPGAPPAPSPLVGEGGDEGNPAPSACPADRS